MTKIEQMLVETMNREVYLAFRFWGKTTKQKDNLIGRLDGVLAIARQRYTGKRLDFFEKLYLRLIFEIAEKDVE